jgi:hypothetical protein
MATEGALNGAETGTDTYLWGTKSVPAHPSRQCLPFRQRAPRSSPPTSAASAAAGTAVCPPTKPVHHARNSTAHAAEPTETGRAHHGRLRPAPIASCTARELSPCRRGYHVGWDTLLRVLADCTGHSIRHSDARGAPPSTGQHLSCTNKMRVCCKPHCMLCAMLQATLHVVCDVACHVACCPACKNDCLTIIDGSASSSRSMFSSMLYLQVNQSTDRMWRLARTTLRGAGRAGTATAEWAHPKWKDEFIGSVAPFIMFFATSGSCRRP